MLDRWRLGLFSVERVDPLAEHLCDESLEGMGENNIFHHAHCLHLPEENRPELSHGVLLR